MKTFLRAAAISLALGAAAGPPALAQTLTPAAEGVFRTTTLSLAAEGRTRLAPDRATINLGVVSDAPTASAAMQANARQMSQVMDALRKGGIAAKDVQTSNVGLEAQYAYEQNLPPRLTGYRASNQVTITVRDLTRLGAAADAAVSAGANQINGISFSLADSTAAEDVARQSAVRALQAKAELYARATGYHVVRLVSLSEGASPVIPPMPMPVAMMSARFDKAQTPVSPGEMDVQVQVSGVYELAR